MPDSSPADPALKAALAVVEPSFRGRCNCGAVTLLAQGAPIRVGVCHCLTCQRETGGPAMAFAVWPEAAVRIEGETRDWGENRYRRRYCPACGSRLGSAPEDGQVELRLGALEAGGRSLRPSYELWTLRRQPWLAPIEGAAQHERERPR